ncbi:hypothetical protein D6851_00200 [Altericroceibacterium spongiae]|uniref:Uncharacterized protein n=1 Tax=Altericroceibacterium spongiae TaxID=2320269 RepID=A0A420EQM0_9SPHN|nr:hypothetical protein D6851_00200 [Altericroceibacterium spongiae]
MKWSMGSRGAMKCSFAALEAAGFKGAGTPLIDGGKAYVRMPGGESRSLPDGAETHLSCLTRRQAGLVTCKRHLAGGDATGNAQRVPLAKMSVWQNRS